MELASDISPSVLAEAAPGRAIRSYEALLSTEADALAWAREGAPPGAVVVAGYQASPRGRGGIEWQVRPREDLGFSLVLRPRLAAEREGWMYSAAACGLADVLEDAVIEWPDVVKVGERPAAAVGVQAAVGPQRLEWAVVSVVLYDVARPRATMLAAAAAAIEARLASPAASLLNDYRSRCRTIGLSVRARLVPLGPTGVEVSGEALSVLMDGALLIRSLDGRRVAVRPQSLGVLDLLDED